MDEIKKIILKYGPALNNIVGKIRNTPLDLSKDEAYFCIEAYSEILKIYKSLDNTQRSKVDQKVREISDARGALDTYSDKSIAIYAFEGLEGLNKLI